MTCYGEGSGSEGDAHEAFNFAAIYKVPEIFVCENNGFAISTPMRKEYAIEYAAQRAAGYGFPGVTLDGRDPVTAYVVAKEAIARARAGDGPTLIECLVDRLGAHSSEDDQRRYRTQEEIERLAQSDCLEQFKKRLARRRRAERQGGRRVRGARQGRGRQGDQRRHGVARRARGERPDQRLRARRAEGDRAGGRRRDRRDEHGVGASLGPHRGDGARRARHGPRRGRRQEGRRVPGHRRALQPSSARRASSTPRWRSHRSPASPSASRSPASGRWPRCSSPTSPTWRSTRSPTRSPSSATAATATGRCRWSSARRWAATRTAPSITRSRSRRGSPRPA